MWLRTRLILFTILSISLLTVSRFTLAEEVSNNEDEDDTEMISFQVLHDSPGLSKTDWRQLDKDMQKQLGANTGLLNLFPVLNDPGRPRMHFVDFSTPDPNAPVTSTIVSLIFLPCSEAGGNSSDCRGDTTAKHASQGFYELFTRQDTDVGRRQDTDVGRNMVPPTGYTQERADRFWSQPCMNKNATIRVNESFIPHRRFHVHCLSAADTCLGEDLDGDPKELISKLIVFFIIFAIALVLIACLIIAGNIYVDRRNAKLAAAGGVPSAGDQIDERNIELELEDGSHGDGGGGSREDSTGEERKVEFHRQHLDEDGVEMSHLAEPSRTSRATQEKSVLKNLGSALSDEHQQEQEEEEDDAAHL